MAVNLIVEDGTGLADANSYITVAEAKEYAANRLIDLGTDEQIAANLVLAADYMETLAPFVGVPLKLEQGLSFPRVPANTQYVTAGVPRKVKQAQAQLLLDIKEGGALITSSRKYAIKRKKIEGLEFEYAVGANSQYQPNAVHKIFDNLMTGYLLNRNKGAYVIR